ncbi:MAG TPA: GNAT family N-acyltransferase [Pyrinomonadaceae bacterium]|nr:GNAT family N-acyltransferase [Pyrinomonadaceae bacterium]
MRTALLPLSTGALGRVAYPFLPDSLPRAEFAKGKYVVRFARNAEELDAVLRLRFEVFNLELNEGLESSFMTGRDADEFDPTCHHLLVVDSASGEAVGTYRLRTEEAASEAFGFYSAGEFDLSELPTCVSGEAVEVGRACVAREHRNKQVLFLLWKGLAAYMLHNGKRYFFGCCSLPTQDAREGLRALNQLQRRGCLHRSLRVPPLAGFECVPEGYFVVDGQEAELPRLFETYLRFGARVCGPPAIDRRFKTVDFFVLFDAREMNERTRRLFFDE